MSVAYVNSSFMSWGFCFGIAGIAGIASIAASMAASIASIAGMVSSDIATILPLLAWCC